MLATLLLGATMIINSGPADKADDSPFLTNMQTADNYAKVLDGRLKHAKDLLDELCKLKDKPNVDNALSVYDNILFELDAVGLQAGLLEEVHPDSVMRSSSELFSQKVSAFNNDLSLNRKVYEALAGIDQSNLDAQAKYYLQKTLRDFKLSGVDKDEATRAKITELRKELVLISQDFARNIRDDVRLVFADNVKELAGLPKDYIERHKPEPDGRIKLNINYPDALPVFTYAKSESLRKRMYMEYNNRAFPKNIEVLDKMISKRYELANLLGFPNWAAYVTADKMIGNEKNAFDFIEKITNASHDRSGREYQILLDRKKQDIPGATEIKAWETSYYSELVRKAKYDFDGQKVRPYFPYEEVKQGILNVYSKLFGVEFHRNNSAPVWHPSVECYDTYENGILVGRFYLDMHPRKNKYNHAAQFGIRNGVEGKQIPESALICNFPGGETGDPGLMEHGDVLTFFHEFGHLLHSLFAGHLKWIGVAGISTEWDFVEAPSQLLEEWSWDPATLQTFALNYQTKEPIPTELVQQMRRANEFGKGLGVTGQMYYAKLSLSYYDRNPKEVNTTELLKTLREKYTPFKYVEGTHMQTSFGHLDGYSAIYYTYMWSLVIAKDLFSKFDKTDLLAHDIAKKYRDSVLAPGGSKPASELVKSFLGRDIDFASWQEWLNEGE